MSKFGRLDKKKEILILGRKGSLKVERDKVKIVNDFVFFYRLLKDGMKKIL